MNLLTTRIDLAQLEADKNAAISIVESLFSDLNKYDGKKISPISITGLSELNASLNATNTSFNSLKGTITEFSLALQQYQKTSDAVAVTQAKIAVASSGEAQELANLKVQLSELNKQNIENAKSDNAIVQQRILQANQQNALAQKQKQDEQSIAALRQENAAAIKQETAAEVLKAKADIQEAKNLLLLNDEYAQLILRQKELKSQYANLYAGGLGKTAAATNVLVDLKQVNGVIGTIDKNLEKAGSGAGGAASFGKALTVSLSQLRALAYILPGIGLAGIFNLAFTAIESVFEGAGNLNRSLEQIIKSQQDYNQKLLDEVDVLKTIDKIQNDINETRKGSVKRNESFNQFSSDFGQSPQTQLQNDFNVNQRNYIIAQTRVQSEFGDFQGLQKRVNDGIIQLDKLTESYDVLIKKKKDLDDKVVQDETGLNKNPLRKSQDKEKTGTGLDALITLRKSQIDNLSKTLQDQQNLLDTYISGEKEQKDKELEINKNAYDEQRKLDLSSIQEQIYLKKNANALILSDQISTEEQRQNAVKSNLEEDIRLAKAQENNVLSDRGASDNDKIIAQLKFFDDVKKLTENANREILNIDKEFYARKSQLTISALENEITTNQVSNEQIFKDQAKTYNDRIDSLNKYIEDRKLAITSQFSFDLDKAERETPKDLLPQKVQELTAARDKQLLEVNQSVQQQILSITETFYKSQLKLIQDSEKEQLDTVVSSEEEELKKLNASYNAKTDSYEKYAKKKEEIQEKYKLKDDLKKIKDDENYINKLSFLQDAIDSKLENAQQKLKNATTPEDKAKATDEVTGLLQDKIDNSQNITGAKDRLNSDKLQYQLDLNKETDKKKAQKEALILLEQQLFSAIKDVVDSEYEYRKSIVEKNIALFDEQVDAEKGAIDRSTLNQKDKNAYEVQLQAQKNAADKKAAKEERKIEHDKASFDKEIGIAEIITSTSIAVAEALKTGPLLAFVVAAAGAVALAAAIAVKIPPTYAKGGIHKEDGLAIFAEAGYSELVKEPNKQPYIASRPTMSYLPRGTELIPLYDMPTISEKKYADNSWEQTRYLAKAISKGNKSITNVVKTNINVSFRDIDYKSRVLHG